MLRVITESILRLSRTKTRRTTKKGWKNEHHLIVQPTRLARQISRASDSHRDYLRVQTEEYAGSLRLATGRLKIFRRASFVPIPYLGM
jgi:hypothetical protein